MRKNTRKKKEKILKRDSFIFYRSFAVALEVLNYRQAYNVLKAIINYGLDGIEEELKPMEKAIFELIKPQLKANNVRYANGCKRRKEEPNPNREGSETEANANRNGTETEANENVNENVNVNVNANGNVNGNENGNEKGNEINANVNPNVNVDANANDINANANGRSTRADLDFSGSFVSSLSCISGEGNIPEGKKNEKTELEKMGIEVDCEIPPDFGVRKIEIMRIAIESSAMLKKWRKFSAFLRNWEDVASGKYSDPPPKRDDNFMRHNYTPEQLASVCVNFDEIDDLDWE